MLILGIELNYWICIIIIIILLMIIMYLAMPSKTTTLYPAVNIGVNNNPLVTEPVPVGNNGVAAVTINQTSPYGVPSGYTFLEGWQFHPEIGNTGMDSDGGAVLSNNNRTMTVSNGNQYQGIAVGNKELTGQTMYSVSMTWPGIGTGCNGVGVATSVFNPVLMASYGQGANQGYVGYDTNSIAVYDNGALYSNGGIMDAPLNILPVGATFQKTNGTNIIDVAVDVPNLLMWYRVDNGPWNNFPSANPTIVFGGINLTILS